MRPAALDAPPLFHLERQEGAHLTLASDTGARAHVLVLEEDVVRLVVLPEGELRQPQTWTVAPGLEDVPAEGRHRFDLSGFACPNFKLDTGQAGLVVETQRLRLSIAYRNLACRWQVRQGERWVEMLSDRPTQAYDFGWWGGKVRHYLARDRDEQYFGLGERSGRLDRMGRRFRLSNLDAMGYDAETSDPLYKHIPFYITRKTGSGTCVGVFYDTLADCTFDFGCEHSNYHGPYRLFEAEVGDLDLYVIAGPELAQVTRRFTWLTGKPMATPDWALSFSGSTMSYTDAPDADRQMIRFLEKLDEHQIPCGSFHLSSGYTSIGPRRYVFHWNRDKFPDPEAFIARYAKAGVRLIANIKPALLMDHPEFPALAQAGMFLSDADGRPVLEQFWDYPGAYLDFTNPRTVEWWKAQVTEQLLSKGIAATWNDNNEYEVNNPASRANGFGQAYPAHQMKPLQTLLMLRASREAQLAHLPDQPPFLVSRAGAAGMQRYAQTWSGDNYTSWKSLHWNIAMGLGLALSGVSNIGHDVGGFAGPRPEPELFLRWIGFGVFMPRFSIHSWNDDGTVNEPWMYPEHMAEVQSLMRLREHLVPYISRTLALYRETYEPAVRPLFYDFPDDPAAWKEDTAFMLGADILVGPVVKKGATHRTLRLPKGADWRDPWTGAVHKGGTRVRLDAPFDKPPFLIRAGAADAALARLFHGV